MEWILAIVSGVIFTCSVYLMLSRNLLRFVFGLGLLTNSGNLLLFTVGRVTRGAPPLIEADATDAAAGIANPLPQALVLTAIVIGFGLLVFSVVLAYRNFEEMKTMDPDSIRAAEPLEETDRSPGDVRYAGARADQERVGP